MSPFPSQLLSIIVFLLTGLNIGCEDPPRSVSPTPFPVTQSTVVSAELPTAPKIQEVNLEPMVITGHENTGTEAIIGVVSEESEDAACKIAGDFLVVPVLDNPSTYLNCGDQGDALYIMKLRNCTGQKIVFTTFTFTVTLSSKQEEDLKRDLSDEFTHFELHVDSDHTSYVNAFKSVDSKSGTVAFTEVTIEVESGEEQFSRLKVVRKCTGDSDRLEFNLDLTGASASKAVEEGVEAENVNGAVFDRPDRQITFMSRK